MLEWADRRAWTAPSSAGARHLSPETLLAKVRRPGRGRHRSASRCAPIRPRPRRSPSKATRRCSSIRTPARSSASRPPRPARVLPDDDGVASLHGARGDKPRHRQGDHRRRQPRLPLHRHQRHSICGCRASGRGFSSRTCCGSAAACAEGARLQLAQRDRLLVGVPLAIVVAGAVPISYPWASNLVYRIVGDSRRAPAAGAAAPAAGPGRSASGVRQRRGRRGVVAAPCSRSPRWRTMTTRLAGRHGAGRDHGR